MIFDFVIGELDNDDAIEDVIRQINMYNIGECLILSLGGIYTEEDSMNNKRKISRDKLISVCHNKSIELVCAKGSYDDIQLFNRDDMWSKHAHIFIAPNYTKSSSDSFVIGGNLFADSVDINRLMYNSNSLEECRLIYCLHPPKTLFQRYPELQDDAAMDSPHYKDGINKADFIKETLEETSKINQVYLYKSVDDFSIREFNNITYIGVPNNSFFSLQFLDV